MELLYAVDLVLIAKTRVFVTRKVEEMEEGEGNKETYTSQHMPNSI